MTALDPLERLCLQAIRFRTPHRVVYDDLERGCVATFSVTDASANLLEVLLAIDVQHTETKLLMQHGNLYVEVTL
jgi:hypothetical protein